MQRSRSCASTDSVTYRIVHEFRNQVFTRIFGFDIARRSNNDAKKQGLASRLGINRSVPVSYEDVAEELLEQKPMHWLPDGFESWEALLKDSAVATQNELTKDQPLAEATWGKRNRAAIKHPLSMAAPALGTFLDMPDVELPGDSHLPRVQSPSGGASQRLVVSPGFEQVGIYHQPGGASGHPLSPYYRAGFDDWCRARHRRSCPVQSSIRSKSPRSNLVLAEEFQFARKKFIELRILQQQYIVVERIG